MDIDHINRDRSDNRLANLRLATRSQNGHNKTVKNEATRGAYFDKRRGVWFTSLRKEGKSIYRGPFLTPEDASAAYWALAETVFSD